MIRRWLALTYYLYALGSPPCLIFILIHYIRVVPYLAGDLFFKPKGSLKMGNPLHMRGIAAFRLPFGLFLFLFVIHDGQAVY